MVIFLKILDSKKTYFRFLVNVFFDVFHYAFVVLGPWGDPIRKQSKILYIFNLSNMILKVFSFFFWENGF